MSSKEETPPKKLVLRPPVFGETSLNQPGSGHTHSPVLQVPARDGTPVESAPVNPEDKAETPPSSSEDSVGPHLPSPEVEAPSADVANSTSRRRRRRSRSSDSPPAEDTTHDRRRGSTRARTPVGLYFLIALLAALLGLSVFFIFRLLEPEAVAPPSAQPAEERSPVSGEQLRAVDLALSKLRDGETDSALERLKLLKSDNPSIPSLDYLIALAALQAGDIALATSSIETSLAKGQRVSDSLALSAALEGIKNSEAGWQPMGDLKTRAEYHLRQAIEADPANPSPLIELAARFRNSGNNQEAQRLLEAAKTRINPVDSATIVDTTLLLIRLQGLPDDQLPSDLDPDQDTSSLIGAAYVALRLGDLEKAASLLATAKNRLPENLYYYLLGDPELRKYATEPELTPLFQ